MVNFYDTYSNADFINELSRLYIPKAIVSSKMTQIQDVSSLPGILFLVNWTSHLDKEVLQRSLDEFCSYLEKR